MTKTPYLTDFPRTVFANARRRRQAEIRRRRDELSDSGISGYALLFEDILPAGFLNKTSTTLRERHFGIPTVFWAWLAQILDFNASCGKALSLIQTWCVERGIPAPANGTSGYCTARGRVSESFLTAVATRITGHLAQRVAARDQWRGLNLKAIDGSSAQLMDTAANQNEYPQPSGQKKGCGFPTMGIVGVTNLSHGGWEGFETCPWNAHDARIAPRLLKHIGPGDLLLADRAFCSYELIARATGGRKCHILMRLHQARFKKLDWRKGKKISSFERLVTWKKPAAQPAASELSAGEWAALPDTLTVRYIKMGYENRNGEKKMLVVVTDLLDPAKYPGEELIDLYARRWEIEVKLRDIKTTLGFEFIRAQTPAMARKTLLMALIAYNLIRALMQSAAAEAGIPVCELSFKGVLDQINSSRDHFKALSGRPAARRKHRAALITLCATKRLDIRPFRHEPRAVKRRPKGHQLLTEPRHTFQEIPHLSEYLKPA